MALAAAAYSLAQQQKRWRTSAVGYSDTPLLPGQKWRVHDIARPHPRVITPSASPGAPPSDAIVLFDGSNLSQWAGHGKGADKDKAVAAGWKVENGYMEIASGAGDIFTREKFADCQLHIEWATPTVIDGTSQWRGNSGIMLMGRYEIQVLDSFGDITYADGQAASIYGQWPPLVNAARPPGEWQSFDIVFEAPRFEGKNVVKQAYFTVFHNGVLVHNRKEVIGPSTHRAVAEYSPHAPEEPLALQDHDTPVRYRNIWIRRLRGYDQP